MQLPCSGFFFRDIRTKCSVSVSSRAVILHNAGSLGFYRDLAAGKLEGKRKKDAAVILAIAAAVILLIISGCVIFLNYFMGASILPSFDWMTLHIAAAIVSFLLMLLHMKQEWS